MRVMYDSPSRERRRIQVVWNWNQVGMIWNEVSKFQNNNIASTSLNKQQRLVSLDVFHGLTVALMIVVEDVGGLLPAISHSPWNRVTLADYFMLFFLLLPVYPFHLPTRNCHTRTVATKNALLRVLKLLVLGLFLQGGYFHGLNHLTYGADIE